MSVVDRVWPAEKNVGGLHRTGRYVLAPVLVAVGLGILTGWLSVLAGLSTLIVGAVAVFAGIVSFVEAHTQKCPGYAAMGIDTCEFPAEPPRSGTEEAT